MTKKSLAQLTDTGKKIAMLTCYDSTFAKLCAFAGVDMLLVGDSLGMVLQGAENTLQVSMQDMVYHTHCVAAGAPEMPIMVDMPYGSYEHELEKALHHACMLVEAGADIIKIEGGGGMVATARHLTDHGIHVCSHLGFTPQSVIALGGYKIQGKTEESANAILADAIAMQNAGVSMVLLEMVPAAVAKTVTDNLNIPTIGIGAGVHCSGQVLVLQDLLGIYTGSANKNPQDFKVPRFAKNFLAETNSIQQAIANYVQAVKNETFPGLEHSY